MPDPATRAPRADALRNRARILAAAEDVLARDGLSASLREIARQADVGLATIYRQFPTKEALYEAVVHARLREVADEAAALLLADEAGAAFFGFFTRLVEHTTDKKMLVDALADWGVDVKAGMGEVRNEMLGAIETLLTRAQRNGDVRGDAGMPDVLALLNAACLAAERDRWDEQTRDRALSIMFDGFRPRP